MKTLILSSVATAALAVTAAYAQPASPVRPLPAPASKVHTRAEVQAHVAQMFARLDTNRDGSVTQAEADAARGQWIEKRRERAAERGGAAFDRLDANKDGQVSRQEWDAGRQVREQRMPCRRSPTAIFAPGRSCPSWGPRGGTFVIRGAR